MAAETDDEFLLDCFVYHPSVTEATNLKAPGMVLAGRTGSGKTAALRYIANSHQPNTEIEPADMAMNYVVNSDILIFLQQIGADLDLFFQVLWKHVLCIEYIRLKYDIRDEASSMSLFSRLTDRFFGDDRRKRALAYLKEWQGKFWVNMDENIKEITQKYERQFSAETGIDVSSIKSGINVAATLTTEQKKEILIRARKIVDAGQLAELNGIIDILSQVEANESKFANYYILVDRLDERWMDDSLRFRMIRALIKSSESVQKDTSVKNRCCA